MGTGSFLKELSAMPLMERLLILTVYAVLAKAVDIFINRILKRLAKNFTHTDLDDKVFAILHTPVVLTVFFIGALHLISVEPIPAPALGHVASPRCKKRGPDHLDRHLSASL
ncbi:MAG: hypothetical protein N2A40_02940 [Desulfobulbaceae bacterium]